MIEIRMKDEALIPMRLFRSRVFSIGLSVNVLVGLGMFGALSTLPLYLQLVKGATPTESGLLLLPMMLGIMTGSILSGQLTSRTGKYKIFPVIGTALLAITFFLMLTVTVDTPYWQLDIYFLMIGAGLGLCMQTMLIAVQNTVPAKDMGVATSSATFFRQLGGTLGVAVFLSLLFSSLPDKVQGALQSAGTTPAFQQAVGAAAADPNSPSHAVAQNLISAAQGNAAAGSSIGDALSTDSSFLNRLDANIARPFQVGYVDSTHLVYIIGGIIMVLAFVLVLVMKELPLRTKSALDERLQEQADLDAAEAADVAAGQLPTASSIEAEETAIEARDEQRESVSTGAHALVGSGGSHAADYDAAEHRRCRPSGRRGWTGQAPRLTAVSQDKKMHPRPRAGVHFAVWSSEISAARRRCAAARGRPPRERGGHRPPRNAAAVRSRRSTRLRRPAGWTCSVVVPRPTEARNAWPVPSSTAQPAAPSRCRTSGWAQNAPSRTPMPCSADRAAATTDGCCPAMVKVTTPMLSTAPPNSECTVTPGISLNPVRRVSVRACSARASADRSAVASAWQAVARATAPGTFGEPASCRSGSGL